MNPIEILGSILGQKAGGSGAGADILKEIFTGGSRQEAPSRAEPADDSIERQARELEDLLNVAKDRSTHPSSQPQAPGQSQWPRPSDQGPFDQGAPQDEESRQNEQAMILVRAMVHAAKCDGEISQAEQQSILSRLENPSPDAIRFLREEFAKPLDVREFTWSVPVGMEQQVYTMSLIAIDVDSDREESYLRELAHGLRLSPEVCDQIKARLTGTGSRSYAL
jgi:hypothetical protein